LKYINAQNRVSRGICHLTSLLFRYAFYVYIVRRGKCNITYIVNFELYFALNEPYDAQLAHQYIVHHLDHLDHLACHAHFVFGILDVIVKSNIVHLEFSMLGASN